MFPTREDAAWLLLGFLVFAVAWALAVVTIRLASGQLHAGVLAPLAILLVVSAAILEIALRRLQTQLTGRRLSPWPLGMVSMNTMVRAISPSTVSEAAVRVGLDSRLVMLVIYSVLAADVIALTVLLG